MTTHSLPKNLQIVLLLYLYIWMILLL